MITFLRKIFIKDYQNIQDNQVREKHGILAAIGGIIINAILFSFKLIIGLFTSSMSIISDAINNLSDFFSCLINLFGFKIAGKPADREHPYGHERIEYIAGMIISFIIISVALMLGYSSITSLIEQTNNTSYTIWAFIILVGSILFKILLGFFYYGLGKAIQSVTLKASMQDSFNDAISTTVVLIAAAFQFYFPTLWWLDGAMSLLVACFILFSGIKMIKETASPLIGIKPDSTFVKKIVKDIFSYEGVLGVHDILCHSYGPTKIFMTVHVEVDGFKDMFVSHDMIDRIEKELGKKYGVLLTIHMDPIDTKSELLPVLKQKAKQVIEKINSSYSFHDFRVVVGPTHTNVIFDLVLPCDCKEKKENLTKIIQQEMFGDNSNYNLVLNIDYDYIGK